MPKNILVLLGNRNDHEGNLSKVATKRADKAIEFLNEHKDFAVITTGGFGEHFNTGSTAHGELLKRYLIQNGINENRILPHTRSCGTLEDAYGVLRSICRNPEIEQIHIITSEFHMERVEYIFSRVLQGYTLLYTPSEDKPEDADPTELNEEPDKLIKLKKEWVDISNYDLNKFQSISYENLGYELRHYDNLSYLALVGAILAGIYILSNSIIPECKWVMLAQYLGGIFLVLTFWYLYQRLANTAGSFRRVMKAVEKFYSIPGLSSTKLLKEKLFGLEIDIPVKKVVPAIILLILAALLTKLVVLLIQILSDINIPRML